MAHFHMLLLTLLLASPVTMAHQTGWPTIATPTSNASVLRHAVEFEGIPVDPYQGSWEQQIRMNDTGSPAGVTIRPAGHQASLMRDVDGWTDASGILEKLSPPDDEGRPAAHGEIIQSSLGEIIQSSLGDARLQHFETSGNGFVRAAIRAYSAHHHLKIRPDDVWLAILTQLSSYVNAHAEELRGSFVAHEGKKELVIQYDEVDYHAVDFGKFAHDIGLMIQDNVVDPELREWILPAFSTTTDHDTVVASVVMMASMQAYFDYVCALTCGLPSVTLLGEKADYELILSRLGKLRSYGNEPSKFADLLTPVLKRFVLSFDAPESTAVVEFWNRIFTEYDMGSGAPYYSGWITAFAFWDKDGKSLYARDDEEAGKGLWVEETDLPRLRLDGVAFHRITQDDVPPGYCTVPVKIKAPGGDISTEMLAGSIGMQSSSSGAATADGEPGLDTLQPKLGWMMYVK